MRKDDFNNIKGMDIKSLKGQVKKLKGELSDLVLDKNMNRLADKKVVAKKRKEIAQVMTVLQQKELLAQYEKGDLGK